MNLTPVKGEKVNAPIIAESPVNIECVVKNIVPLGTHDMFVADVANIQVDDGYLDDDGLFRLAGTEPLVYNHGFYYGLGPKIGKFGWSVEKKKRK
jgi:flavin reductase (DIM6/NTAB) family NADH-FMN oxidoreductase RutF